MTRTSQRRRSRELVLQGLYQRQLSGNARRDVRDDLAASPGFLRADQPYFDEAWTGIGDDYEALLVALAPYLDRKPAELSPIERAILVIGAWELKRRVEIPYRVVINEAVELAKSYGGTDGHRYVNGVLDKLAGEFRAAEITATGRGSAAR
jgi:N utilization substance protein B